MARLRFPTYYRVAVPPGVYNVTFAETSGGDRRLPILCHLIAGETCYSALGPSGKKTGLKWSCCPHPGLAGSPELIPWKINGCTCSCGSRSVDRRFLRPDSVFDRTVNWANFASDVRSPLSNVPPQAAMKPIGILTIPGFSRGKAALGPFTAGPIRISPIQRTSPAASSGNRAGRVEPRPEEG